MNDIKEIRTIIRDSVTRRICQRLPLVPALADYILTFVTPRCAGDAAIYASGFYELCQHVPRSIRLACRGSDLEVVKMLVEQQALTTKESNRGVFEAIYARRPEVSAYMMTESHARHPETPTHVMTEFHAGNIQASIRGLVAGGDMIRPESAEALIGACIGGDLAQVTSLLTNHSYIYEARSTAMQAACRYGRLDIVKCLEGYVAASICAWRKACKCGDEATVKYLMPTNVAQYYRGAESAAKHGHLDIVKLICGPAPTSSDLSTIMCHVARRGHLNIAVWALPLITEPDYGPWIWLAVKYGRLHIIKYLATITPISPANRQLYGRMAERAGYPRVAAWFRRDATPAGADHWHW